MEEGREELVKDHRLGKKVKILDVSQRRGHSVFGRIKAIIRYPECELWCVLGDDWINVDAHSSNFELVEGIQDEFTTLPLTLEAMEVRLRRGQLFRVVTSHYTYALWYQHERFLLLQGKTLHKIHQPEVALFTLLNCLGEFDC
jgi:hypothetical protein